MTIMKDFILHSNIKDLLINTKKNQWQVRKTVQYEKESMQNIK